MAADINWPLVIVQIAGGVALLLIGVGEVSKALKALSGTRLRSVLNGLSGNRFKGAITGAVATALVQSSSVTTVLTVSFVSAGLLTLTQAASVVIGANLGTTVTAQIVALDVTEYALGIIAAGGLMLALGKRGRWHLGGQATVGLGLVFLGLTAMSSAMMPLRDFEPFTNAMAATANPFVAALIGAVVAATIQSSSATTGIVVAMSAVGLVGLPTGIALVLGANIGTCVTAVLAALGRGRSAMQTAVIHVLVNLLGAVAWLFALDGLVDLVQAVSGSSEVSTVATPRELANAHLIFNAINTVVFLAFLPALVWLARRIVADRPGAQPEPAPLTVSDPLPSILPGLDARLAQLAQVTHDHLQASLPAAIDGSADDLEQARQLGREVRTKHRELVGECATYSDEELGRDQRDALEAVLQWGNILEQVAATTSAGVLRAGRRRLDHQCTISAPTARVLSRIHELLVADFDRFLAPLCESEPDAREWTVPSIDGEDAPNHPRMSGAFDDAYRHLSDRLLTGSDAYTYAVEVEMLAAMENVAAVFERFSSADEFLQPSQPDRG